MICLLFYRALLSPYDSDFALVVLCRLITANRLKYAVFQLFMLQQDTELLVYVYRLNKSYFPFSLHAGVAAARHERQKLERLCRYMTRPAIAAPRLSLTSSGKVRYQLKTPYRDGTTHVIFEPLDFIARLAALVPRPRVNLTRDHGMFAPNSPHRALVTKAGRGRGAKREASEAVEEDTPATRRPAMTRAQSLKRVFRIDVEACQACGGAMRIIASIGDPVVRGKILAHLEQAASGREVVRLPGPRAPPDGWSRRVASRHSWIHTARLPARQGGAGWTAAGGSGQRCCEERKAGEYRRQTAGSGLQTA